MSEQVDKLLNIIMCYLPLFEKEGAGGDFQNPPGLLGQGQAPQSSLC